MCFCDCNEGQRFCSKPVTYIVKGNLLRILPHTNTVTAGLWAWLCCMCCICLLICPASCFFFYHYWLRFHPQTFQKKSPAVTLKLSSFSGFMFYWCHIVKYSLSHILLYLHFSLLLFMHPFNLDSPIIVEFGILHFIYLFFKYFIAHVQVPAHCGICNVL